ncbi:MAG: hypothetical protein J7K85_07305, partial [Anaerolineaceae bacterium]|nr:hypothetical protein [Anaerolineaceae bacterium]
MAEIRCPMCGKNNPEDAVNCIHCNARIVPMGDIGKPHTPTSKHKKNTDEFIDSLFSENEQKTKSTPDPLENEILNLLGQDTVDNEKDNVLPSPSQPPDKSSITDWLEEIPKVIKDNSSNGDTNTWLNVVFSEEESVPLKEPDALEENEEKSDDSEQSQKDKTNVIAKESEKKDELPEWFSIILDEEESEEIIPPPEELPNPQLEETEESPPEEKVTWDEYSTKDKKLKLPEWFTTTNEEKTSKQQEKPPEIKKETLDNKKSESLKKRNPWNWLTGRKKEKNIRKAEEIKSEPTAFEGTAPLPGWLSEEDQEEVPSEEEAVLEQTEPAAIEGTAQLPDWMAGIDAEEAQPQEEAATETIEPAAIEGTAQLPDWMAGIYAKEAPSEEEAVPETTEPAAIEGTAQLP